MAEIIFNKAPKEEVERPGAPVPSVSQSPTLAENVDERAKHLFDIMGWGSPPPDLKLAADAPAPSATIPATTPVPSAAAPEPAPEPVDDPAEEPELTNAELITKTAQATATAVAAAMKPAPTSETPAVVAPEFEMGPDDAEDYKAVVFLETQSRNRKNYVGLVQKFVDYLKKLYAYQDDWLTKNTGKEFNTDDEEHDSWFENNQPPVDRKTLDEAKIDHRVEEAYQERVAPELKELKRKEVWQQRAPDVFLAANKQVVEMVKRVNPDFAAILVDASGNPALTKENAEKLDAKDPIAKEILDEMAATLWPLVCELEKTAISELDMRLNPAKNQIHAHIDQFRQKAERDLIDAPAEQRTIDGKTFVTIGQWNQLPESQRANHWTLTVDNIQELIVDHYSNLAKNRIEKQDFTAKKKYGPPPTTAPTPAPLPTPADTAPAPVELPKPAGTKPRAPSLPAQAEPVATPAGGAIVQKTFGEQAADKHFR